MFQRVLITEGIKDDQKLDWHNEIAPPPFMPSEEKHDNAHSNTNPAPLVVFGEVLFDCFSGGKRVLGGAPFNVAWGLKGLGQDPLFVSAVGDDGDGKSIRSRMTDWGMRTDGLQTDKDHSTGVVEVTIHNDEPSYQICEDRAWDHIQDIGWKSDGLIYHGLLSLRNETSCSTLKAICDRSTAKRFFDVNLRPPYDSMDSIEPWLYNVDWLKLNLDELGKLTGNTVSFEDCNDSADILLKTYNVQNILLTAGSQGAQIIGAVGSATLSPAPTPNPFVDTVGAGDSFAAFTIHGILEGLSLDAIISRASQFASKVCGIQGATTTENSFYQ